MKQLMVIAAVAGLMPVACQESDLGTGANTVIREYSRPAPETWNAAFGSAEAAGLKVSDDRHDQMGGELVARRGSGSEVRIQVKSLDEKNCRVSVRVEPGDRELANQLHERIAERVGLGEASVILFKGNSIEGSYTADLTMGVAWARQAFSALRVTPTSDENHATWARLDGRLKDSTPVRIRLEKSDALKIVVTFIAGNSRSDDNQEFARKMKVEFEKVALTGGNGN